MPARNESEPVVKTSSSLFGAAAGPTTARSFLITVAAFVVLVAGMQAAASLVVPFLLAAFVATICAPPLLWLQRKKVPAPLALLIVIAAIALIGLIVAAVIGGSLNSFSESLPLYQIRIETQTAAVQTWLQEHGLPVPEDVLASYFDVGGLMSVMASMVAGLGGMLANGFLIFLTIIFILLEASSFPAKIKKAFGEDNQSLDYLKTVMSNVRRYMAIKTVISFLTGILVAAWLAILGVDFALLWGLIAFLFNYVPNIGSIIAAVPAIFLALVQLGVGASVLTGIGYLVINIVIGNFVEPRFMGRGVGLSTLVVFLSLVFWGWVLGPVGMFLSVPLTMTVKIALESSEHTQWASVLLGSEAIAELEETAQVEEA
jgi:AI-2 transport protein TqsA